MWAWNDDDGNRIDLWFDKDNRVGGKRFSIHPPTLSALQRMERAIKRIIRGTK
jgi:hypothetical protein